MNKQNSRNYSYGRTLAFLVLTLIPLSSQAALMQYTFEGIITGFKSYHSGLSINDFDVVVGETEVTYVFELDFDANNRTSSNSAGTWSYFYTETISGSIINGMKSSNVNYQGFNWVRPSNSMGQITGSQLDVRVQTSEFITDNWRVQDWEIGQSFRSIDSGCFSGGNSGCAVYAYGDVMLTSITTIPVPGAIIFFISGICGLSVIRKIA